MKHTHAYLKKKRDTLLNEMKRRQKSALSEGTRYSKYRTEASKEFFKKVDLSEYNLNNKRNEKGERLTGEELNKEIEKQIEDLKQLKQNREHFMNDFNSSDVNMLSDDTLISWTEGYQDDGKNHIFMKDIREQWNEAGASGDENGGSPPTWVAVLTDIFDKDVDDEISVGSLRNKLNERGVSKEDRDLIRTLLNQIQRENYYKGKV